MRRLISLLVAWLLFAAVAQAQNIVVIMLDDAGQNEFGYTGSTTFQTPNIDALAAGGKRFSQAYVPASVCTVTRAGLLTGRYPQRFHLEDNTGQDPEDASIVRLPAGETTLAEALKNQGYTTGMVGKWHLGKYFQGARPYQRGFDSFLGFFDGFHDYWTSSGYPQNGHKIWDENGVQDDWEQAGEYLTDAFSREAVEFIDANHANDFFLYVSYNAPHAPLQAKQGDLDQFPGLTGDEKTRAAMLLSVDRGIGDIVAKLEEHNIDDSTYIFFIGSDNGGKLSEGADNSPFRGEKATMYEGGLRTPFIVSGPNIAAGDESTPVTMLDVFPTAIAATGGAMPTNLDGVDLIPLLENGTPIPTRHFLFRYHEIWAVVEENWKLVRPDQATQASDAKLYDLAADPGEQTDVSDANSAVVDDLLAKLDAAEKEWFVKPHWSGQGVLRNAETNLRWVGGNGNWSDSNAWEIVSTSEAYTLVAADLDREATLNFPAGSYTSTCDMLRPSGLGAIIKQANIGAGVTVDGPYEQVDSVLIEKVLRVLVDESGNVVQTLGEYTKDD